MKKDGNEIKWDYYKLLYNKQIDEGYHLATKLKLQHILFYRGKTVIYINLSHFYEENKNIKKAFICFYEHPLN